MNEYIITIITRIQRMVRVRKNYVSTAIKCLSADQLVRVAHHLGHKKVTKFLHDTSQLFSFESLGAIIIGRVCPTLERKI